MVNLVRIARNAEKMGTRRATPMPTILCPLVSSSSVRGASVVGFMVRLVLPVFKSSSSSEGIRSGGKMPGGREMTRMPLIRTIPIAVLYMPQWSLED